MLVSGLLSGYAVVFVLENKKTPRLLLQEQDNPLRSPGLLSLESLGLCLNCRSQMVSSHFPNVMAPKVIIMRSREPTSRQAFIRAAAVLLYSTPLHLTTFFILQLIFLSHVAFTHSSLANPGRLLTFSSISSSLENTVYINSVYITSSLDNTVYVNFRCFVDVKFTIYIMSMYYI